MPGIRGSKGSPNSNCEWAGGTELIPDGSAEATRAEGSARHTGDTGHRDADAVRQRQRYGSERREDNVANSVSLQSSEDEGESFGRRLKLSSKSFDSRIGFGAKHGLADLGSRVALVSDDRRALAVWTDTRAGTQASNKQDLAHAVVGFSDPARLSETAQGALRYGGLALTLLRTRRDRPRAGRRTNPLTKVAA